MIEFASLVGPIFLFVSLVLPCFPFVSAHGSTDALPAYIAIGMWISSNFPGHEMLKRGLTNKTMATLRLVNLWLAIRTVPRLWTFVCVVLFALVCDLVLAFSSAMSDVVRVVVSLLAAALCGVLLVLPTPADIKRHWALHVFVWRHILPVAFAVFMFFQK
jgi:hypothetical protein